MKKITTLAIAFLLSFAALAQEPLIMKYMDKYENDDTFTKISLNSKMFSLFANMDMEKEEDQELMEVISKIKGIKILVGEDVSNAATLYKNAVKDVDKAGYDELMTVKDGEENVKFSIREKNGKVSELIMVIGGNKQFVMVDMFGEIDLAQIGRLGSKLDINGFKNLSKL